MNFSFSQLFDQFNTADSYTILAMLLIAFLLGMLVGMILRSGNVRRYREENEKLKREANARNAELTALRDQLTSAETTLEEARQAKTELEGERAAMREEVAAASQRAQQAEQEKQELSLLLQDAGTQAEQLETANKAYLGTIDELNERMLGLQTQNERLASARQQHADQHPSRDRLALIERKMERLETENSALKQELRSLKTSTEQLQQQGGAGLRGFTPFGGAERNDLTRIEGIDADLEQRLHRLGVYTFEQLGNWDEEQLRIMGTQLGDLETRIRRQNWVEQARRLAHPESPDPEGEATPAATDTPDDLKLIEGIGPKIEQLLRGGGITTFEQLADSQVEHLRELLNSGGELYHLHDPTTWPIQARLAYDQEWSLLRDYQEQLKGGRAAQEEE